ncbi:MAG: FAD-binding protein, partial [Chlorobiaceae bacterium]|nr:FAD-binding protein [Chlorobiaceae bacterium]
MQESPFPCPFEADAPLSEKSYYRIGGPARFFALPETIRHIGDLLLWNREQRLPLAVMGSGSNMLFSDEPFPGIVLSMERMNRMFWISRDELFCEAGAENTAIAAELLDRGRSGGEWLHMLPGRIGSTVRMNARCFGGEISGVTSAVVTVDRLGR